MDVYVFGNRDIPEDAGAIKVADRLSGEMRDVRFVPVGPNEDVPFADAARVVILDAVEGIGEVTLLRGDAVYGLLRSPRSTAHDFDLALQLGYLAKIGRLGEVVVIGVPREGVPDHLRVRSILRELVAQDMQGS